MVDKNAAGVCRSLKHVTTASLVPARMRSCFLERWRRGWPACIALGALSAVD